MTGSPVADSKITLRRVPPQTCSTGVRPLQVKGQLLTIDEGNRASGVVIALSVASEKLAANVDALAGNMAKTLAEQIEQFYKERGWR